MANFTPNEYENKLTDIKLIFESLESDSLNPNMNAASIQVSNNTYNETYDELVLLKNQIIADMETMLQNVNTEHNNITKYDEENEKLRTRYIDIKDKIEGAIGMRDDAQTLYNHEYYGNILIFLSIIGGSVLYARTRGL